MVGDEEVVASAGPRAGKGLPAHGVLALRQWVAAVAVARTGRRVVNATRLPFGPGSLTSVLRGEALEPGAHMSVKNCADHRDLLGRCQFDTYVRTFLS